MKKALIIGANGYLGRHLAAAFSEEDVDVRLAGNSSSSIDDYSNYEKVDVRVMSDVERLDFKVDYIFLFAAKIGVNSGFDCYEEFVQTNEIGLLNVLNHYRNSHSSARLVFPSTRLVYKGVENKALSEDAEKEAKTIYAQNKLACENYLRIYHRIFGVTFTIFRICVPYGNTVDRSSSYGTLNFFLSKARNGENISIYGNGKLRRTFTHVEDICKVIIQAIQLENTANSTFNIEYGDCLSLGEVANSIAQKFNVEVDHVDWPETALKLESGDTIFDGSKLEQHIDFIPQYSFGKWLDECVSSQ